MPRPQFTDHSSQFSYTCIACSPYGLLQYLLLQDEEAARKQTFYFFAQGIPDEIRAKLPSASPFTFNPNDRKDRGKQLVQKLWLRLTKGLRWPFLRHTKIYAQDQSSLSMLIGRGTYAMLADAEGFLALTTRPDSVTQQRLRRRRKSAAGRLEAWLFSPINLWAYGDNPQCTELYLTSEEDEPVMKGKKVHVESLQSLWDKAPECKRRFILDLFGMTESDMEPFRLRPVVFFSQPMVDRHTLTEEEYVALLKEIFAPYALEELLVKAHPFDSFRYEDHFPGVAVYRKKVNSQLLSLAGARIKKAITICSTSVQTLPKETEVVWLGPSVHPKVERFFGANHVIEKVKSYQ